MNTIQPRILIVDDDPQLRHLLERTLVPKGFTVLHAATGEEALRIISNEQPNLLILDLGLPDISGEEVCRRVRKNPCVQSLPILILTGRSTEGLLAKSLEGGADDYLDKPYDISVLVARVRALLRRPRLYDSDDTVLQSGPVTIHIAERRVLVDARPIPALAPKEFELLRHLMLHAPKVVNKNTLALKVWGVPFEQVHERTMGVHVRRIRQKLGPAVADCLKTIPGIGLQWTGNRSAKAVSL